jgi:sarcosine oxidase
MTRHFDAIVVGLGAWGSATLSQLASRGTAVLGIDQFAPPHTRGSHHGNGRVIRMASPEAPFYTPIMRRAYQLWHDLEAQTGVQVLTTVGGVYAAPSDDEMIWGALESYRGTDIAHEVLNVVEARQRFPWLHVKDGETVVHEPGTGRLHPERSITAHLELARRRGAELAFGDGMLDWKQVGDRVTVTTADHSYTTDRLILTLGSWAPNHLRLNVPLTAERQVFAVYDTTDVPGPMTMFSVPSSHAEAFYGLPEQGGTFKLALHHGGISGRTEELPVEVNEEDETLIKAYVADRLPHFPAQPLQIKTCKYTNTPDRHFVLCRHPEAASVVIGAGCSGRGFKFAPFIGEALADLAVGVDRPDLRPFSPERFQQWQATP